MKTFEIPEFGITVKVTSFKTPGLCNGAGTIESKLKEHLVGDNPGPNDFELIGAGHAIESLILAHACSGLDVAAPAYVEGIRASIDALGNHYS
jgi:hypothetical protein